MKTRTYEGIRHGDWVRCVLCGAQMLLPCGADKCPECNGLIKMEMKNILPKIYQRRILDGIGEDIPCQRNLLIK